MKTKIIFRGSVWKNYYSEHIDLRKVKKDLGEKFTDDSIIDTCLNTIIINRKLSLDDITMLLDFLMDENVWNYIEQLSINIDDEEK